jgi:hypothetical protein
MNQYLPRDTPADGAYILTKHAKERMKQRQITFSELYNKQYNGKRPTIITNNKNVVVTTYMDRKSTQKGNKLKGFGEFSNMFTVKVSLSKFLCSTFLVNRGELIKSFKQSYKCLCKIDKAKEMIALYSSSDEALQKARIAIENYNRSEDVSFLKLQNTRDLVCVDLDYNDDPKEPDSSDKEPTLVQEAKSAWDKYWEQFL